MISAFFFCERKSTENKTAVFKGEVALSALTQRGAGDGRAPAWRKACQKCKSLFRQKRRERDLCF